MNPRIEFCAVKNFREFNAAPRSTNWTIVFRVRSRAGRVEFDADWHRTELELSLQARQQIASMWDAEQRMHPCHRAGFGGGRSCAIFSIACGREDFWRDFLSKLLSRPGVFVQLKPMEAAA